MTDYRASSVSRSRRPGIALLVALVAISLVVGALLASYVVRNVRWFGGGGATTTTTVTKTVPSGFTPAQPLGVGETAPPAPAIDPALLATRETALAGAISALETRTAAVTADANAAGAEAARAEALLVAFAARRAIDRGAGLGYLEEQLRTRFGQTQPRAVTIVIQAARAPVTLEDLRQGLDGIAEDVAAGRTDESWLAGLSREIGSMVVLRRAGTPSPLPADRMARAKRLLDGGQVEAAKAEVLRLPGADRAANWIAAARRYILARQALDAIESAAILGQGTTQPTTAAAPPAATPPAATGAPADPATTPGG